MKLHRIAVPRERHIGGMAIKPRRRQNIGSIHGHALRSVDGRGIAVIGRGIILETERNRAAVIPHRSHTQSDACYLAPLEHGWRCLLSTAPRQ